MNVQKSELGPLIVQYAGRALRLQFSLDLALRALSRIVAA